MIITCDKCDTQFELDENPEQLVDSDVRCVHCNAILDVDMQAIRKRVAKSSKSRSDASAPKTPEKEKNFLRTDMPGKKRKKKSKSKSLKSDLPKSADVKGRKGDAADTGQDMPDAVAADAMGGGFLEKSDDLDFLMDREEDSGAGDIVNEKTEVLNIDDYNDIEFRAGSNGKPDSGKISGGPDGADFSIDRDLFLDFDLDGMGIDTDSPKGIDSPGAPSDADEFDEFDEMEPFALDLDDEFSVDSDGETIVLDMDMDDESEKFHNPLSRDIDKDTADVNSKAASPKMNSHGLPDDSDELEPFSMDLDGPLGSSDKDGLLDLFLGLDMDQMKTSGESSGGLVTEGGGLKLGIEDSDLDADMASSSDEARLGLDENLLLDMDLDFDEDEHGLATVVGDGNDDASKADHALGESPDDVGLGLDENLLLDLDLDLDFDEDEQGLATVVADSEDGKPTPDPVSRPAADDAELGLDEDLLLDLDLDLDFDEDEQGLATVAVDGQGENLLQESAPGEAMNDADPALDENLLTDLDLDLNVEKGEETPAALELTDAEDDSIELTFDLDDDDMGAADETPAVSEEEFSLELDIDDAEDALSLSDDDGDAPVLDLETALEGVRRRFR